MIITNSKAGDNRCGSGLVIHVIMDMNSTHDNLCDLRLLDFEGTYGIQP